MILATFADRHKRIATVLAMVTVMSMSDLILTVWAHKACQFYELNPFARHLLNTNSIAPLIVAKLALTSVGVAIFWNLRRYLRAEVGLWLCLITYIALTIRWAIFTMEVLNVHGHYAMMP